MSEAMERIVRFITQSHRFYFLIAIVVFFSGVFVRGEGYFFPWMLSWIVPLLVAIYLLIIRKSLPIIRKSLPIIRKKKTLIGYRRIHDPEGWDLERKERQKREEILLGEGPYMEKPPTKTFGRCVACGQHLKSPGLYIDGGDGPYGPDCAKKVRRSQARKV